MRASDLRSSCSLPTKELAGRGRFVFEIVLSGGKEPLPSWKIGTGSSMSFRRCSPRSAARPRRARQSPGEDHLAAVAGGSDAGGEVDVVSDVALVGQKRSPGVEADPHPDRPRGQRAVIASPPPPRPAPSGRRRRRRLLACRPRPRPARAHASRITRRCSASASAYPSAPSSCRSLVEPSTSVKRKVTVPLGRSPRTTTSSDQNEHRSNRP